MCSNIKRLTLQTVKHVVSLKSYTATLCKVVCSLVPCTQDLLTMLILVVLALGLQQHSELLQITFLHSYNNPVLHPSPKCTITVCAHLVSPQSSKPGSIGQSLRPWNWSSREGGGALGMGSSNAAFASDVSRT